MDNTYGRKVIRHNEMKKARREFTLYSLAVLIAGIAVGAAAYGLTHRNTDNETVSKNEDIMQHVNQYGAYDGKTFTSEVSLDWTGDEYDFIPLDCALDEETQKFTFYLCKGYDIDWTLVMAVMQKESSFRSDVISGTNDYGLMQINQINHDWLTETLGVTDYLDKEQNIRAGVFVLRKLFEEYTETDLVLMAYNMGASGAETLWNKGIYSTSYVDDIREYQAEFNKELEEKQNEEM